MPGGCWSSLPSELLNEISARLSSDVDHLSTHQVCTDWRASTCLPAAYRPWIVAKPTRWNRLTDDDDYSFWLLRGAQRVEIGGAPAAAGLPCFRGTSRGWLALTDHAESPTRLVLWEPLSNTQIPLPCLNPIANIFLSGDPLISSPLGWMVIACQPHGNTEAYKAFFCRAQDAAWTVLYEKPTDMINNITFHGGKMYCLDTFYYLYVYDVRNAASPAPVPVPVRRFHMYPRMNQLSRGGVAPFRAARGAYLVTCDGELLLVVLRMRHQVAEVYRTEWEADGALLPLRDRVTDLGEHSLFVGRDEAFSVSAKASFGRGDLTWLTEFYPGVT